tara:strand:- start:25 stop:210 length:186 start_codon:yes stop_codon:yes gene_type:complete
MNANEIHAKRISLIYKASESISKDKRKEFIKLGLKLAYLDANIDEMEKFFNKQKGETNEKM